jgi:hypothetical protein
MPAPTISELCYMQPILRIVAFILNRCDCEVLQLAASCYASVAPRIAAQVTMWPDPNSPLAPPTSSSHSHFPPRAPEHRSDILLTCRLLQFEFSIPCDVASKATTFAPSSELWRVIISDDDCLNVASTALSMWQFVYLSCPFYVHAIDNDGRTDLLKCLSDRFTGAM